MNRFHEHYINVVRHDLMNRFFYKNSLNIPKLQKIVLHSTFKNVGLDKSHVAPILFSLSLITSQKPLLIKFNKSMANFKVKKGTFSSSKVTITGSNMYLFLDRLITSALPKIRDFKGLSYKGFDGRGNYSFGISNIFLFNEIEADYDLFDKTYGLDITIITSSNTDIESFSLLTGLQLPIIR